MHAFRIWISLTRDLSFHPLGNAVQEYTMQSSCGKAREELMVCCSFKEPAQNTEVPVFFEQTPKVAVTVTVLYHWCVLGSSMIQWFDPSTWILPVPSFQGSFGECFWVTHRISKMQRVCKRLPKDHRNGPSTGEWLQLTARKLDLYSMI